MRSPLSRRVIRNFRSEFGKYAVLFVFIAGMIAIVSGFLVASGSLGTAWDESFVKYNTEHGNFELAYEADDSLTEILENENLVLYDNRYIEEETKEADSTLRIFINRTEVNKACLMDGRFPENSDEIAIDRMYADNNGFVTGDTITVAGRKLTVTGLIALPDYSALYQSPSDMMFDAVKFGVAVMTEEGFEKTGDTHIHYSYSWKYNDAPADDREAKEMSEDFLEVLKANAAVIQYIPEYSNNAIHFTGEDVKGDNMMFTVFLYMVVIIISFIFGITTVNTIKKESQTIGTLRASGYTRAEIARHYLVIPVIIMFIAAAAGNILGYTFLKDFMAGAYYGSYSLPTYVTVWNADAFVKTTVVPVIILLIINIVIINDKLQLSPLRFLRGDLSKKKSRKAFRLNTKISIRKRFRLRIIFQNMPNYITLFFGIFLANLIILFSLGLEPLVDNYQDEILSNMICENQYILKMPAETENEDAEKVTVFSLMTTGEKMKNEEVTVYGIESGSRYIDLDTDSLRDGEVYISNAYAEKRNVNAGDIIKLAEKYGDREYSFLVKDVYYYPSALAVFAGRDYVNETSKAEEGYFNGYFSDSEIDDIDERIIGTVITEDDLTKTSRQLKVSMGEMMTAFTVFGALMFVLIIYMLSKIIIESNSQSISMTKILGYSTGEINSLYILTTTLVVIGSVAVTIPAVSVILKSVMKIAFSSNSGYLPFYVPISVYIKAAVFGLAGYAVTAFIQMARIRRIPMSDALKNRE